MDEHVFQAALGGLLHDIGKLEQRAKSDPWNIPDGFEREGQPVHATWSAYFAQQYLPARYQSIGLHAAYHHAPDRSPAEDRWLSTVIALADKLSAGERADSSEDDKRLPPQLVSIFDRVALTGERRTADWHYLPLKPLALNDALFPDAAVSKAATAKAYADLCEVARAAARQDIADHETYLLNLLNGLQRATWCVPSAYYHSIPDVSLYDHARMTAALAACLAEVAPETVRDLLGAVQRDFANNARPTDAAALQQPVALLIGGDVSGVQSFIYTLSAKGAAKTLRGRSFYLQLLNEAILQYVLREMGVPDTNVIYSGGGHFYLLAPLSAAARLPAIRRYIAETLLAQHGTGLYLALDAVEVPADGFKLGNFPAHWEAIHLKVGRAKQRRYLDLNEATYDRVFKPAAHGGNQEQTCSVCGEEHESVLPWDEEQDARICDLCRSMAEDIGKALPKARYVALGLSAPRTATGHLASDVLQAFGVTYQFVEQATDAVRFPARPERAIVWALDDVATWPSVPGVAAAQVVRYTVKLIPTVKDRAEAAAINARLTGSDRDDPARPELPKTFTHLQAQANGIPRLGVLRMDVDELGELFSRGFGDNQTSLASLARISTLSFQLGLFFEGWIKRLCERYDGLIYAVYAGGDDVFLIGPWDRMPELAQTIASELSRYAGGNPDVHLSGGIAFVHGKYPIYQAANDAHDALEQAKHIDGDGKNAFSFLGRAWKWAEFKQIAEKQQRLLKMVGGAKAVEDGLDGPQAILQTLRQLAQDEADAAKQLKGRPVWGPWMWHGAYQFTRAAERVGKKSKPLQVGLIAVRDELSANNYSEIAQWGVAARWTQLRLRENKDG